LFFDHLGVDGETGEVSIKDGGGMPSEQGDEFIRNFFIKFGMRRTLEAF
jgi:hypothetical protein